MSPMAIARRHLAPVRLPNTFLRPVEIQMAPVGSSVHIPAATLWAHFRSGGVDKALPSWTTEPMFMIDDLFRWTAVLNGPRALLTSRRHHEIVIIVDSGEYRSG